MIIKEKSIKSYVGLQRVLQYIFSKHQSSNPEHFVYRRYIKGDRWFERRLQEIGNDTEAKSIVMAQRLEALQEQFYDNDKLRIIKRKGETKFYHAVLSFSNSDKLSREALLKTAKKYAKERFPKSMVVAVNHTDTDAQHIHLVGSNVEFGLGTTRYLSRKQFAQVKGRMEVWQDRELNLKHSRVDHTKKKSRFEMQSIRSP